jgi:hypothetical protein
VPGDLEVLKALRAWRQRRRKRRRRKGKEGGRFIQSKAVNEEDAKRDRATLARRNRLLLQAEIEEKEKFICIQGYYKGGEWEEEGEGGKRRSRERE